MTHSFQSLGVSKKLIQGIEELGIHQPTVIQQKAIPYLIEKGGNLVAQAQTGGQGDDAFNETAGFDLINAGTGTDVVQFGGLRASYSVLRTAGEQIAVKNEITHGWNLLDSVERLCDRVVVLHEGRVLAAGSVDEVVRRAGATDIRAAFGLLTGGDPR